MATSRLQGRRGDGSAVVNGWVAFYTLGLPGPLRTRRRDELAAHLVDEAIDAVRRGNVTSLRRRRLVRWILGIPDDLIWRVSDARAMGRDYPGLPWTPLSRWTSLLLAGVALGAGGAFAIVANGLLEGRIVADVWSPPGPQGFLVACLAALLGIVAAVPWPRAGVVLAALGAIIGTLTAPWLWGCWGLALIAVGLRWFEARSDGVGR
jgi:hypothetical protein